MDRVIHQYIFDVIIIHPCVSECCTGIRIIIASKRYWLLINHLSNRWYIIRRLKYDALILLSSFHRSFSPQFRGYPLLVDRVPLNLTQCSEWNNSSHDSYQGNLFYTSLFSIGAKKCDGARIMIRPLQRCQGSFLSIADFCRPFSMLECSSGHPSKVLSFYLLCMCDHPC
jgi:hypothetical protein